MRHRLSLSGHSVQFDTIDSILFSSIMDPTTVKTAATQCYSCKSFDHTIGECLFPLSASTPFNKTGRGHHATAQGYQTKTISQPEVFNNFNNLCCVLMSCKRLHVCRSCSGGTSHMNSISSKDIVQWPRPFLNHEFWVDNYLQFVQIRFMGIDYVIKFDMVSLLALQLNSTTS